MSECLESQSGFLAFDSPKSGITNKWKYFIVAMIPVLIMALYISPRIWFGSDNLRLLEATGYSGRDETAQAIPVFNAVSGGRILVSDSWYGNMYQNIVSIPLGFISRFVPVTEQTVIVIMRSVSLMAYIALSTVMFFFALHYLGDTTAIFIPFLTSTLFASAGFIQRATMVQPHMMEYLWIVCGLYCCCLLAEEFRPKWLILSSVFAGLLMSTRLSGMYILLVIFYVLLGRLWIKVHRKDAFPIVPLYLKLMSIVPFLIAVIGVVSVCYIWIDFSPGTGFIPQVISYGTLQLIGTAAILLGSGLGYVLMMLGRKNNVGKLSKVAEHLYTNSVSITPKIIIYTLVIFTIFYVSMIVLSPAFINPVEPFHRLAKFAGFLGARPHHPVAGGQFWVFPLMFFDGLGPIWSFAAIVGMLIILKKLLFSGYVVRALFSPWMILSLWCLGNIAINVFIVHLPRGRWLLTFLPVLLLIAMYPFLLVDKLIVKPQGSRGKIVFIICLALIVGMSTYFPLRADARLKEKIFNSIDSYPGVRIGRVLAANYSPNVKILCSSKSYIPTEFMNIKMDPMNMTIEEMKRYDPDIIILRMNSVEFWRTVPGDYSPYALGYVKECRHYYDTLVAGGLGYHRVASEGSGASQFILYERVK